jgi:tRNA A-37 threonylcarbamoyl transferase component Bud32/ActR/RegA family two-component response regulator
MRAMRVLLIDPDATFRHHVAGIFTSAWPGSLVEHYDPQVSGRPGPGFALNAFDLVILDNRLGAEDGLEWLQDFRARPGCPPTVMLAGQGSESVAVRAMKLGAHDYLPKQLLTKESLERIVTRALGERGTDETLDMHAPPAGAKPLPHIEGYRLLREVGCGAVSQVYLLAPEAGGKPVIAKVLYEHLVHDSDFLERFLREYQIVGRIRSRHVAEVFGYGFSDNSAYILMEYLPGGDVRAYFTGNYVDQVRILRIFRQVLTALKDIHAAGVVHRDLKPHNVMFREDQSLAMVDFGIAKVAELPSITVEGMLLGTPVYMSPEAIRGQPADPRSDLYSAGIMLYRMLAKQPPFTGDSAAEIIEQHLNAAPPPLPRAYDEFQPLIDALLAKDAEARPASAEATLKLIDQLFYGKAQPA